MRRRRRVVVAAAAVVIAIAAFLIVSRPRHERPDVILVTIDTLRADALGFAGNRRVSTPYLDSLAARGVVFTNAHAHNVVTLPSHTNILTGLYPYQHGIRDNAGFTLDPSHPTLGRMLHDAGYATGAFVSAFPLDSRFGLNA
ncbi:MAG TPA: sulfatase-like hydrolase/transferase, partial [Thermoanaerobaculia bacterium]|nr:sulfatase-like hydrolase/transferase [Thermoanaerobaculia bacterium]